MSELSPTSGLISNMENGTFLEPYPTSLSTSMDSSSGRMSNVYVYVSIFLSLLAFLLLLLIIALQRLKNIISSSSSYPEYTSDGGSSFTNLEVCSISSQRSTFSNLSTWKEVKENMLGMKQHCLILGGGSYACSICPGGLLHIQEATYNVKFEFSF